MNAAAPAAERLLLAAAGVCAPARDPHAWRDVAIGEAVEAAWRAGDAAGIRALADDYSALVLQVPHRDDDGLRLAAVGAAERRRRGAFATPPALAATLAAHALPGLPAADDDTAATAPAGAATAGPEDRVPRVVDPACGSGALLRAAFARLLTLGVPPGAALLALHGADDDPAAVAVCRAVLAVEACAAGHPCTPGDLAGRIVVGDALLGGTPARPRPATAGLLWHEAFAAVLDRAHARPDPVTGWRGGFDAVVANPPWERLKVTGKDWAGAPPQDLRELRADAARAVREGGRHPLTGAGEVNAYLPFAETCWRLLGPRGRAALVVPAGIASDRSAAPLLEAWLRTGSLERLHLLDPPGSLFPGVSRRVGIAVVVLRAGAEPAPGERVGPGPAAARVAVGLADPDDDPGVREWRLDAGLPRLVNPNTGTLPLFTGERDAAVVAAVHRRVPVLVRRSADGAAVLDAWGLRLVTPLHMTRDARWFATAPGPGLVPLWEAKHAGLLDPRGGARREHRYWVPRTLVEDRFGDLVARGWLAGYRNVTTVDSPRTLLPTPIPVAGVGNSLPLLSAARLPLLLAALASLPVDHVVRSKHAGANLNFFKLEQAAVPPPEAYDVPAPWAPGRTVGAWVLERLAAAVVWRDGLEVLAAELAGAGVDVPPPVADGQRRALALADLDAVHALLLGLDRADLEHVLSTFTVLRAREVRAGGRFLTAERVLASFDTLAGDRGAGARRPGPQCSAGLG